jgi:hypothetical protein
MKVFALIALLPFVAAKPSHPAPAYGHPAPAYGHHAPAYGHPAPAYGHHAPAYGGYGYEQPKHNCSVIDVVEKAEVCTPTIATECNDVELAIKVIVAKEFCYDVTRTVCEESIEIIPNEVCTYSYEPQDEATTAKTVEVVFTKETKTQMVTVCQPGYGGYGHGGYGHGGYGHQYCNEVAQETQYNVPSVPAIDVDVTVTYPKPVKTCVDKPISLPRVACNDITVEKCIQVPEVEDSSVSVAKCVAKLGEPECIEVELTLPKQVCVELVYGYAHEHKEHPKPEPAYAPAHA